MSQMTGPGGVDPAGIPDQQGATTGEESSAELDKEPTDDSGEIAPEAE